MSVQISVLIPSIRPTLLEGVYDSINKSFSGKWELVLASPYPLPDALKDKTNIIYIEDHGTPIRGRQRALIAATGEYICYAADDVVFYPNALNIAYESLKDKDYKTLVVGKYMEGEEENPFMQSDEYWKLYTHDPLKPIIPDGKRHYLLINTGLISRKLMLEIGGFDCKFEACAISCVDLSIRLQNYESKCILQNEAFFYATHLPGGQGDHGPIDRGQVMHDQPLLQAIYLDHRSKYRAAIDVNNWEKTSDYWERRYGPRKA